MNYLDNPLYPKDILHKLFENGTLTIDSDGVFSCPNGRCPGCLAENSSLFCSVAIRIHDRIAIAALLKETNPEYFI